MQLPWPGLPGVWQLAGVFSLSLLAHGDELGEEEKGERVAELEKEGRNGGTWSSKGAVNPMVTRPLLVVRPREAFPIHGLDRDELRHGGHQKL